MSKRDRKFQLWGWWLFIVSALFFVYAGIQEYQQSGDLIPFLGGFFFLLACIVFLWPYYFRE